MHGLTDFVLKPCLPLSLSPSLSQVGERVVVSGVSGTRPGILRYMGTVKFAPGYVHSKTVLLLIPKFFSWDQITVMCHSVYNLPYFFDQTLRQLFFSLFVLVRLLIEDGYYLRVVFISRYKQSIQLGLIDAGSSTHTISVLLLAVETSLD